MVTGIPHGFDYAPRTRLVYGPGVLHRLGGFAVESGAKRALLVTDRGIVAAGHASRAEQILRESGLTVARYDGVHENPTTADVAQCVTAARESQCDLFVGLGGGSSMDTAKGANFILTNGGRMQDYWGVGKASKAMLPLIAVPTTAGTGSECQSAALIADEETHQKMACLDPKAAAWVAILDPELTLSQPLRVTSVTGIDALAHALESAVTRQRTPLSSLYAREAWRLGSSAFFRVLAKPGDIQARGDMMLAAAFAGIAIENSMLGAVHAAANPLTAHFGVVHGTAVGLMLPAVLRFNALDPAIQSIYTSLCSDSGGHGADDLAGVIRRALEMSGLPTGLAGAGVRKESVPMLAAEAGRQWTARFNPRPLEVADFEALYLASF